MDSLENLKRKIEAFQIKNNFGRSIEDNFAPWWLKNNYKLSDEDAMNLCSDGNFDFGIDGFYIEDKADKTLLSLIQAKYSSSPEQIKKGIQDIQRFLPIINDIIENYESENYKENIFIKRLRAKVPLIEISKSKPFEIEAYVISISSKSQEYIEDKMFVKKQELLKEAEKVFSNPNIIFSFKKIITLENLCEIEEGGFRPGTPIPITFNGSEKISMDDSLFYSGIGKLSDLVNLYENKGNQLFEKNVRLYLYSRKNREKGPAGKIRETLQSILEGKNAANKFAFLHNGVTIYSHHILPVEGDINKISLSNPFVLNGCQTIKSAFFFLQDKKDKSNFNKELWQDIPISVRIISTHDDNLWREVAEANNRQNSMKSSALRANDEIQIKLENRFAEKQIFYERQEGAFENESRTAVGQKKLEEKFYNSPKIPITMETLCQAIICLTDLPLSYATRYSEVFESTPMYNKVFSEKNLMNIELLVLTHNIRRVIHIAIHKIIDNQQNKFEGFKASRYRDLITRLVLKVIVKNDETDMLNDYSIEVINGKGKLSQDLTEKLRKILNSNYKPIMKLVGDYYKDEGGWVKQDDNELYKYILNKLYLKNVDVISWIDTLVFSEVD